MNKKLMDIIENLPMDLLGVSWRRSETDKQKLKLVDSAGHSYGSIWKINSTWGCLTGNSFSRQMEAKADTEAALRARIITTLEELNSRMECLRIHHNEDMDTFTLTPPEYNALSRSLSFWLADHLGGLARNLSNVSMRSADNRLGNALLAFDCNGKMASFLEASINYQSLPTLFREITPSLLSFSVSVNKNAGGEILEHDNSFVAGGRLNVSLLSLDESMLKMAANNLFLAATKHLKCEHKQRPASTAALPHP